MMDQEQAPDGRRLTAVAARERIMAVDDGPNSHPVRWPRQSREEFKSVYNQFAYQKGGAVLLMLEAWLGEDRFQLCIPSYLPSHRMGNSSTADVEGALSSTAPRDTRTVMDRLM